MVWVEAQKQKLFIFINNDNESPVILCGGCSTPVALVGDDALSSGTLVCLLQSGRIVTMCCFFSLLLLKHDIFVMIRDRKLTDEFTSIIFMSQMSTRARLIKIQFTFADQDPLMWLLTLTHKDINRDNIFYSLKTDFIV